MCELAFEIASNIQFTTNSKRIPLLNFVTQATGNHNQIEIQNAIRNLHRLDWKVEFYGFIQRRTARVRVLRRYHCVHSITQLELISFPLPFFGSVPSSSIWIRTIRT